MPNESPTPFCPCCRNADTEFAFTHKFILDLEGREHLTFSAEFHGCKRCHHLWYVTKEGALTEEVLQRYYKNKTYVFPSAQEGKRHHTALSQIVTLLEALLEPLIDGTQNRGSQNINILEIGGGDGEFADVFLDRFASAPLNYRIFDWGPFSDENKGFKRVHKLNDVTPATTDLLIARHTLEHILAPADFVRSIADLVRPGGFIYVEVPCWTLPHFGVDEINPEHLQHFTHTSIDTLFAFEGRFELTADFSCFLKDFFTKNRVLGKIFQRKSEKSEIPFETCLSPAASLKGHYARSRQHLERLAVTLREKAARGEIVGIHSAAITFQDFLMNEGSILRGLENVFLFDNAEERQGTSIGGLLVRRPTGEFAQKLDLIVSFSSFVTEIHEDWRKLGFTGETVSYLNYGFEESSS